MEYLNSKFSHSARQFIQNTASNIISLVFVAVLLLCLSNVAEAQFSFNSTNWTFVDKTPVPGNFNVSSFVAGVGGNPNHYVLSDTFVGQIFSCWHSQSLNLSQDFMFSFRITFGNGKQGYSDIADGVTFTLTTQPITDTLIGGPTNYIGYVGIPNSFAIEFDTEFNVYEGGPEWLLINGTSVSTECHTAYLQGSPIAIPGTYQPMLDNFASVRGQTICVTVIWKRTNGVDSSAGYDLITFIEGVERNNMHFATLGDLIPGLNQNNFYSNFGITSATCYYPNRHEIEFISLMNGNLPEMYDTTDYQFSAYTFMHLGKYEPHLGKNEGLYVRNDIRYTKKIILFACSEISLEFKFQFKFSSDTMNIPLAGICLYDTSYINDGIVLWSEVFDQNREWSYLDSGTYKPLPFGVGGFGMDSIRLDSIILSLVSDKLLDTFIIRLVALGDTMYFAIPFSIKEVNYDIFSDYFADSLPDNMQLINKGSKLHPDTLIVTLVPDSLEQSIKLPLLDSCEYVISGIDSSMFTASGVPKIVGLPDSAVLNFQFLDTCGISTSLEISLDCYCISPLNLVINAPECDEEVPCDCESVNFYSSFPQQGLPLKLIPPVNPNVPIFRYSYRICVDSLECVVGLEEPIINDYGLEYKYPAEICILPDTVYYDTAHSDTGLCFAVPMRLCQEMIPTPYCIDFGYRCQILPIGLEYHTYSVTIRAILESGEICEHTANLDFTCGRPLYKFIVVKDSTGGIVRPCDNNVIGICYELYNMVSEPLHIAIYDKFGYKQKDVMSEVPTKLSDTLTQDISMLPPDDYQMVFLMGNQLEIVPFTIEGIIKSAAVVPNPTSGIASVDYELNCLPSEPMRVTINDIITGNELIELHNGFV
ncbi:MAG: hypothetical protein FWG85_06295, partial [Bacteroidetes bacterium]|nr:hypothetical protein [Bacteroidota bacterium]